MSAPAKHGLLRRTARRAAAARAWLRRRAAEFLYRGDRVACELCGWRGRAFPAKRCPRCGSLARHRLVPYAARHLGAEVAGRAVLHVGANREEARWVRSAGPRLYARFDLVRQPATNVVGDVQEQPIGTGTVDLALIWHVLEHVPEDRRAIRELYRVLRPGGSVLVSVPIYPPGRAHTHEDPTVPRDRLEAVFGHEDHVRACGLDYADRFRDAGFEVRTLAVAEEDPAEVERYALSPSHVAWLCTRPERPGTT